MPVVKELGIVKFEWETPIEAGIRLWEEKERIEQRLTWLERRGYTSSEAWMRLNDRRGYLEDIFRTRNGETYGWAKTSVKRRDTMTVGEGMIGKIGPIPFFAIRSRLPLTHR
ncbi:MAG: hypothetical protein UU21_C0002G0026 [Candidatus Levybacteria bacterium GW2011_GWA2_40_8]|nr:MAG: hypothetical protein UU21_C0002G0026 [Candidatus Levybacteria bacterium GW2011_GWA2_40_8]